jgi:hypothetical protein
MKIRFGSAAIVVAALAAATPAAFADDVVVLNKESETRRPAIASDGKGGLHVAYLSYEKGNVVPDVFHTVSSDGGKTWEKGVNVSRTPGISCEPAIACGKDGQEAIVWLDTSSGIERPDVYGVFSSDGGVSWSKAQNISDTLGKSFDPDVAIAPDGTIHVVWADTTGTDTGPEIWHAKSTDKGVTWSKGKNISSTLGDARGPRLVCGPKNEIYLCWVDKLSDTRTPDVMFSSSSDGGKSFSRATHLANTRTLCADPVIAADDKGIYLAWSDLTDRRVEDIFFMASRDGGKTWEKQLNITRTAGRSSEPAICAAEGQVVVAWRDTTNHEAKPDICFATSTDHGKSISEPKVVSSTPGNSMHPDVAISDGKVCVIWDEYERGLFHTKLVSLALR